MSFERLRNLFSRTFESSDNQQSILQKASSFINNTRRSIPENPIAEFEEYFASIPQEDIKHMKNPKHRTSRNASLRPQLVKRCYQNVPSLYFDSTYQIKSQIFTRNRKDSTQRTLKMQQYLDEVELCLFNQISSRFDQILSVLRTIESLQCVVVYNAQRLAEVRQNNMAMIKQVSSKNMRIVSLLKKQQKIKSLLEKMQQIKFYQSFLNIDTSTIKINQLSSHHYQLINNIRDRRDLYFQLQSTKQFEEKVQQFESTLKKSYSDTINDALFNYATEIIAYHQSFWQKKFIGRIIFEQDQPEADGTVILDQSVLVQEDTSSFKVKINQEKQQEILENMLAGWREGEYSVGNLKAAFDKFCKEKHARFSAECRNFAFQNYLREERKKIENPNIANIMSQMNIFFCCKTFIYYADMYRTMLARIFSMSNRAVQAFIEETSQQLSIDQKEKITLIIDGLLNIMGFLFKIIYEKIIEMIELKRAHEAMDLNDFKQLINVFQTQQDFIEKYLRKMLNIGVPQDHFLFQTIETNLNRLNLGLVKKTKEEKVIQFLNRTHRYIIQNQIRQSFENEIWQPTDIPTFYYDSLHYLITGQSLNLRRNKNQTIRHNMSTNFESSVFIDRLGQEASLLEGNKLSNFRIIRNQIIIDQKIYKVTQTLLLLLEIIQDYMHLVQFYPFAGEEVGAKILQLLRVYNTSSSQLIIFGGAVKLQKIKTKNITARHLALNSLCLSFLLYIIGCISKRVTISEQEKIRKEIEGQYDTTIKKLNSILTGKNNSMLADINLNSTPSKGTQSIVNNTKILHDILSDYYTKEILAIIFTKQHTMTYLNKINSIEITTKMQAECVKDDMHFYFHQLAFLEHIVSDFKDLKIQSEVMIREKFQDL